MKKPFSKHLMKLYGYDLDKASKELLYFKSLTREKKLKNQLQKRWSIVDYHSKNNSFYKRILCGIKPKNWSDLPIMEKKDFQIEFENLLSNAFNKNNVYIANTSGSTGQPFFYAKDNYLLLIIHIKKIIEEIT